MAKTRHKRQARRWRLPGHANTPRTRHRAAQGPAKASLAAYFPGLPVPVAEYAFAAPQRKFLFDLCWPDLKLAVEQEGGLWIRGGGRHNRAASMIADMSKYNLAALLGYRVFRFTPDQVRSMEACAFMHRVMEKSDG